MGSSWQYLMLFVGAIVVVLAVEQGWKWLRRRSVAAVAVPERSTRELQVPASVPAHDPAPVPTPTFVLAESRPRYETKPIPEPALKPPPMPRYDPVPDEVEQYLRLNRAKGDAGRAALEAAIAKGAGHIPEDDVFRAALGTGYAAVDVGAVMVAHKYELREIANLLVKEQSLDANALGDILMPFGEGTVPERAEKVYSIVRDSLDLAGDDDDLIALPVHLGCSKEEAAALVYQKSDLCLAAALSEIDLWDTAAVARLEEEFGADLADDNEYKTMREEKEFPEAAAILKACKKDPEAIIRAENEYDELSGSDSLGDIFIALASAGFSNGEIMEGVIAADVLDEDEYGTIVAEALHREISIGEIVSFLKDERLEPDSLDEELRNVDMDVTSRIDVMHAFLHAKEAEKEEAPAAE